MTEKTSDKPKRDCPGDDLEIRDGGEGVEFMLRSTERVRVVVRRCPRCCAPDGLVVRIRETLTFMANGQDPPLRS